MSKSPEVVGLSFSICIKDMIEGKVDPSSVRFLSTGTCVRDQDDFEYLMESYSKSYWFRDPDAATALARMFWVQGRVVQPRLEGQEPLPIQEKHWVTVDEFHALTQRPGA